MDRNVVRSSNLKSVGYNEIDNTLEIEFNDSSVYQYLSVPASIYKELMSAPSHGSYFHKRIKDNYTTRKIM